MLKRTPLEALQEDQESSFRRLIRTFDPDVPGYVLWPIIFVGGRDLPASGDPRLLAACGGWGSRR